MGPPGKSTDCYGSHGPFVDELLLKHISRIVMFKTLESYVEVTQIGCWGLPTSSPSSKNNTSATTPNCG